MPIKTLKQKMAEGQEVRVMAISAFPSPKLIEVAPGHLVAEHDAYADVPALKAKEAVDA